MNKFNKIPFQFEGSEFKPFDELELSMVLGGGGDEQLIEFQTMPYSLGEREEEEFGGEFTSLD